MEETKRRDTFTRAIQRLSTLVDSEEFGQLNAAAIENHWNTLDHNWNKFEQEHLTLVADTDEQDLVQRYEQVYEETELIYHRVSDKLRARLDVLKPRAGEEVVGAPQNVPAAVPLHVTMTSDPNPNTYGKFDGELTEWHGWRDQFRAAVHDNEKVPPVMKLRYLLNAVSGAAAKALGTWELTDPNYKSAWDRLCEVYNDERLMINAHLSKIFELPELSKATYDGLRLLVDTTIQSTRQLTGARTGAGMGHNSCVHVRAETGCNYIARLGDLSC